MGKLIETLGIAEAMKGKIIHRPALEGGVELVASGEAELGLLSEKRGDHRQGPRPGRAVAGGDPAHDHLRRCGDQASAAPDAGEAFIAFMRDPANRAVWDRLGFDKP